VAIKLSVNVGQERNVKIVGCTNDVVFVFGAGNPQEGASTMDPFRTLFVGRVVSGEELNVNAGVGCSS
jgi:hypothetical protein